MNIRPKSRAMISSWWWTIDRVVLFSLLGIMVFGIILIATASPYVANRIGVDEFHFIKKQMLFLVVSIVFIIGFSLLSPTAIRRISLLGLIVGILALITTLIIGTEIKGATRWITLAGISLQPSEFVKPFFIVISAWLLSRYHEGNRTKARNMLLVIFTVIISLLILQPDFGMTVLLSSIFAGQLFLAGLPLAWILVGGACFIIGMIMAYYFLPHVHYRINSFLNPEEKSYQVRKSLQAISEGGVLGKGPGEGTVKQYIPDAHTDFIFAVAAEELGIIFCMVIVALFATVVIRSFMRFMHEKDIFILYAAFGLTLQFGLQSLINMGVALDILPTKGMTLPFVSYGGSSVMALSVTVGMLIALTRKRFGDSRLPAFHHYQHNSAS